MSPFVSNEKSANFNLADYINSKVRGEISKPREKSLRGTSFNPRRFHRYLITSKYAPWKKYRGEIPGTLLSFMTTGRGGWRWVAGEVVEV